MAKKKDLEITSNKSIEQTIAAIEMAQGKGAIMFGQKNSIPGVEFLSSGCIGLDEILGGGWAKGRIVEIYGPECVAGDTYIPFEVWSKDGETRRNHKGGSIARLYERFHQISIDEQPLQGRHLQNNDSDFYVKSVDEENRVIRNKILNVIHAGKKMCYTLETEDGQSITASADHKFLTPTGYRKLSDIKVNSTVFVHNNTRIRGRNKLLNRPEVTVKYHPHWPTKIVDNKYVYYRGQQARAAYEAYLNKMSYDDYIYFLNTKESSEIDKLRFLPSDVHIHHRDEDFLNNSIENLHAISPEEHGRLHAKERIKNLSFVVVPSKIKSIVVSGYIDTYDLTCEYPNNNYIADSIVVHNSSGKTTLALHAIAEVQKTGELAAFIDVEHAFDPEYAEALGIDLEKLAFSQPDSGEQALQIAEMLCGSVGTVVIDSVSALLPRAEIEKEIGDSNVGRQASLMSQAMRKFAPLSHKTGTTIIFINQIRMKIGIMFGNPETTSGGNALKFYASQRVDVRRIGGIKEGETVVASKTRAKVVKNKVYTPFGITEFDIKYGEGIDIMGDLLDRAVDKGLIKKSGSWYSRGDQKLGQGKNAVTDLMKGDGKLCDTLREELKQIGR